MKTADDGLTEEEQEFMEMIIDCEMQTPEAFNEVKPFAEISISRATIFSALVDYAKSRQDYKQSIIELIEDIQTTELLRGWKHTSDILEELIAKIKEVK